MYPSIAIHELFDGYAAAFDKLDFEKQAQYFADNFMMAGPNGIVSQSKEDFLQKAGAAADFYKKVGQTSARLISIDELPINREYVMVRTHWGVTFQKTGTRPVEFDISYVVHFEKPDPKIVLAMSHEDEQEAMQKLGLLKKEEYTLGPSS